MGPHRDNTQVNEVEGSFSSNLGVYIHIPFCEKKCFYCDFYSIENQSQRSDFVSSLLKEIELYSLSHPKRRADTIFFGGGTPSLLAPAEMGQIIDSVRKNFEITPDAEFTIECNPGTVDTKYLAEYREIGANRLSFGVQSFFDDELKFLSRIHDSKAAVAAFKKARDAGFDNINIDLMYALPGQTKERVLSNLSTAVALAPNHISAYSLIVEPGTPLFSAVANRQVSPADENTEALLYETVMSFMGNNGFHHYEISNYSIPGFKCRHNLKYWDGGEYAGFGPSAHSHLGNRRFWNVSSLNAYLSKLSEGVLPIASTENLSQSETKDEFIFLSLRKGKLSLRLLRATHGVELAGEFLSGLSVSGYAVIEGEELVLTRKGFTVCDEIASEIAGVSPDLSFPL